MRNVRLVYLFTLLYKSWFWYGIWVLYYLRFTNYAGIGLLESTMIITRLITEVPTGVLADVFGKKKILMIAFALSGLGNLWMGLARGFWDLFFSVILQVTAGSFSSGTVEALLFDSLKDEKKDQKYDKIISNTTTMQLIALAIASIVGGILYTLNPRLPFLVTGLFQSLALIVGIFLVEPRTDTIKVSLSNIFPQNIQGLKQLFKNQKVIKDTVSILSISIFLVILYEVLIDTMAVDYGFTARSLGVLLAIMSIVAAVASQFTDFLSKRTTQLKLLIGFSLMIAGLLIMSPYLGMLLGGVCLILLEIPQAVLTNVTSVVINRNTDSAYRATTLSTFSLLSSIPYALTAFFIGKIIEQVSVKGFASVLGITIFVVLLTTQLFFWLRESKPRLGGLFG